MHTTYGCAPVYFTGALVFFAGGWKAAFYVDDKAKEAQQHALTQIFTGQAGGHPGMLVSQVGEVLGIKSVAIDYHAEGKRRRMRLAITAGWPGLST